MSNEDIAYKAWEDANKSCEIVKGQLIAALVLLTETKSMVMRTDENREWLERRNRLLSWPTLEDYSK